MNNEDKKKISRRDFFKIAGAAGAVTTGLAACGNKRTDSSAATNTEVPTDAMTYRTLRATVCHCWDTAVCAGP